MVEPESLSAQVIRSSAASGTDRPNGASGERDWPVTAAILPGISSCGAPRQAAQTPGRSLPRPGWQDRSMPPRWRSSPHAALGTGKSGSGCAPGRGRIRSMISRLQGEYARHEALIKTRAEGSNPAYRAFLTRAGGSNLILHTGPSSLTSTPAVGAQEGVHSRGAGNWDQLTAGSGGSQGLPAMALAMASSAVTPWAAAESR
jgi:hypothetical protein